MEVWVDCTRIYKRIAPPPITNFTKLALLDPPPIDPLEPALDPLDPTTNNRNQPITLYLGQRNSKHFLYKVRKQYITYQF